MEIVILGAGSLGSYLATLLSVEGHSITVIDKDPAALLQFENWGDVATADNSADHWGVLSQIANREKTSFLALTGHNETNLVACAVAKALGFARTVARVSQSLLFEHADLSLSRLFGVDHFLNPKGIVAEKLAYLLQSRHALLRFPLVGGRLTFSIFQIVKEMSLPSDLYPIYIYRKYRAELVENCPSLQAGDEIAVIGYTSAVDRFSNEISKESKIAKSAVLSGGYLARELAPLLKKEGISLKVIEKDPVEATALAKELPDVTVLEHDAADADFFIEEQIDKAGIFIGGHPSTESNILDSVIAQEVGNENVICLINDRTYTQFLKRIGIRRAFSGKISTSTYLLSLLYQGDIVQAISFFENRAKIVELQIHKESKMQGKKLLTLVEKLEKKALVFEVGADETLRLLSDEDICSENTHLLIATPPENMAVIEKEFSCS